MSQAMEICSLPGGGAAFSRETECIPLCQHHYYLEPKMQDSNSEDNFKQFKMRC